MKTSRREFIVAALVVCAMAARAEVVSLDGTWLAEVAQDAQGDAVPAAFTRTTALTCRASPATPAGSRDSTATAFC